MQTLPTRTQVLIAHLPKLMSILGVPAFMLPMMVQKVRDWQAVETWCAELEEAWHDPETR